MIPYIITFGLSYMFCFVAEDSLHKYRYMEARIFFFFAVLVVAILAGCRDVSVGPDTISYTTYFFDYIRKSFYDFESLFLFYALAYEPGFIVFVYALSEIFNDSHWLLFWSAMIIYGFSLKTILKYKNQCSVSLVWILFLTLTCTEAFNIIRQYMAMAIGMYAFTYAMDRKYKMFFFWFFIAVSFHYGALIYIPIYLIYQYLNGKDIAVKALVVISVVLLFLILLPKMIGIGDFGLIGMKMGYYANDGDFLFQVNPFLTRLLFIILIMCWRRLFIDGEKQPYYYMFERNNEGEFFILLLVVELILSQARGINVVFYRFTSLLVLFKFIAYSRMVCLLSRNNKYIMQMIMLGYISITFVYWVVILNSGIYPYTSKLLGIE